MHQASNEALVVQYRPYVRRLARHMKRRLGHTVDLEDLEQAGLVGLIEGAPRFRAVSGARFETFIGYRIRGAMVDSLREGDWTPRSVNRAARDIAEEIHAIEIAVQRPAREAEIAERLGLSLDDYRQRLNDTETRYIFSLEGSQSAMSAESLSPCPEHIREQEELGSLLQEALAAIPERERMIIEATFFNDATLLEVGAQLGLTESRVCQLRAQGVDRLRAALRARGVPLL